MLSHAQGGEGGGDQFRTNYVTVYRDYVSRARLKLGGIVVDPSPLMLTSITYVYRFQVTMPVENNLPNNNNSNSIQEMLRTARLLIRNNTRTS